MAFLKDSNGNFIKDSDGKIMTVPNGTADQEYNPLSTNAQSGIAVEGGKPGRKTEEVGEIFNDYTDNKAGTKAFNIISATQTGSTTGTYTLDSVTGLTVGMVYSVKWDNSYINRGLITSINGNVVTVDNFVDGLPAIEDKKFFIVANPALGTSSFDKYQHSEGENTKAVLEASHAEGRGTIAADRYSHAEGKNTLSYYASHAEGNGAQSLGDHSHAQNYYTHADGENSHAEGDNTYARGKNAHAEGSETQANFENSHAEGMKTQSNNLGAHAEGRETIAGGAYSHAGGQYSETSAYAESSFVHGIGVKASKPFMAAFGKYNQVHPTTLFAIGYGDNNNKANAFEVTDRGTVILPNFSDSDLNTRLGFSEIAVINGVLTVL